MTFSRPIRLYSLPVPKGSSLSVGRPTSSAQAERWVLNDWMTVADHPMCVCGLRGNAFQVWSPPIGTSTFKENTTKMFWDRHSSVDHNNSTGNRLSETILFLFKFISLFIRTHKKIEDKNIIPLVGEWFLYLTSMTCLSHYRQKSNQKQSIKKPRIAWHFITSGRFTLSCCSRCLVFP